MRLALAQTSKYLPDAAILRTSLASERGERPAEGDQLRVDLLGRQRRRRADLLLRPESLVREPRLAVVARNDVQPDARFMAVSGA